MPLDFLKNNCSEKLWKFTKKSAVESFFDRKLATLLKMDPTVDFPRNFLELFKTIFLYKTRERLLLNLNESIKLTSMIFVNVLVIFIIRLYDQQMQVSVSPRSNLLRFVFFNRDGVFSAKQAIWFSVKNKRMAFYEITWKAIDVLG